MATYNTGNPIGSTDSRDRLDNTENMDYLENSTTELTHPDRLGTVRKTRHGMEAEHDAQISAHESEHDAQISAHESEFDIKMAGMAFSRVGTFAAGYTLTDARQTLLYATDGHDYGWAGTFPKVVAAGATPATSGGIGAGAWVDRTDVTLRSDLASESGSELVGYQPVGTGTVVATVQSKLREFVSVKDFGAVGDGVVDDTAAIQKAIDAIGLVGGGDVYAPRGSYKTGPLIIRYDNVRFYGDGEGTTILSTSDFTTLHNPTVWIARNDCSVEDMAFTYVGWNSTNLTSLLTTRPNGNSYFGNHICSGYTELFTGPSSGVYNTFRGVLLQVVRNPIVRNVSVIGAAVHAFTFLNTVGAKVSNNRLREFKGTGIYGFISPEMLVSQNDLATSGDDAVFIGSADENIDGVWTPITKAELRGITITGNSCSKIATKGYGVSGYDGVVVVGNYAFETRAESIFMSDEPTHGISAPKNVQVSGNVCVGCFGGFGAVADGYARSVDIRAASGNSGVFCAISLNLVDGFVVSNNVFERSAKVSTYPFRGFFGTRNIFNGQVIGNYWKDFFRNQLGNEVDSIPYTKNIVFSGNHINHSGTEGPRLIHPGLKCTGVRITGNLFRSLAPLNVNVTAAIWATIGTQILIDANTFDLPNGLSKVNTVEGPDSVEILSEATGQAGLGTAYARVRRERFGTAAPTVGTWDQGDKVWNATPTAGGFAGFICVTSGTPGTWKTFGAITS